MRRLITDQRGMTLVELLVAIAMGTVVIFVASTMIISSLNVTNQVTGRMTAVAQGRTGIETLLGQLNSGCLVNTTSPVLASTSTVDPSLSPVVSSDNRNLVFTSGLGDSTNPTPTLHVVQVNASGALLDYAYGYNPTASGSLGDPSSWRFYSTSSQVLNLAQHVTAGSNYMFTYYAYSSSTDSLQGATAITPLPLTSATAPTVAEVDLDFRFAPSASGYSPTATSELQDSAVFSLTAQDASAANGPCQ